VKKVVIYVEQSHWEVTYEVDDTGNIHHLNYTKRGKRPTDANHYVKNLPDLERLFPKVFQKLLDSMVP